MGTTAGTILAPVRPQKKTEGIVHEDDDENNDENEENIVVLQNEPPSLSTIRKTMLPKAVFDIDTKTSLFYFAVDLLAVVTSMGLLKTVVTSSVFQASPLLVQILLAAPLQTLTGFAMWCMWCIGHDAGHGTVSKTKWINRVVGEIAHSVISVTPFVPWQKSHRRHHMHHNHIEKDYSHQWFIREEADDLHPLIKLSYKTRNFQLPILYFVYLVLGVPDGGHFFFVRSHVGCRITESSPCRDDRRVEIGRGEFGHDRNGVAVPRGGQSVPIWYGLCHPVVCPVVLVVHGHVFATSFR